MQGTKSFIDRVAKAKGNNQKAIDALQAGVRKLADSNEWQKFLRFNASFHSYSVGNRLLIWSQRPGATQVASYKSWKSRGRCVRKGENGIAIICPIIITDKKTEEKVLVGFKIGHVFDVAQTEGESIAKIVSLVDGQEAAAAAGFDALMEFANSEGVQVSTFEKSYGGSGRVNGLLVPEDAHIYLRGDLPLAQRTKTLAHELAHWVLEHGRVDHDVTRSIAEVEAESCAYVICNELGIDSGSYYFGYIASWADGDAGKISNVAERVIGAVDKVMKHVRSNEKSLAVKKAA